MEAIFWATCRSHAGIFRRFRSLSLSFLFHSLSLSLLCEGVSTRLNRREEKCSECSNSETSDERSFIPVYFPFYTCASVTSFIVDHWLGRPAWSSARWNPWLFYQEIFNVLFNRESYGKQKYSYPFRVINNTDALCHDSRLICFVFC